MLTQLLLLFSARAPLSALTLEPDLATPRSRITGQLTPASDSVNEASMPSLPQSCCEDKMANCNSDHSDARKGLALWNEDQISEEQLGFRYSLPDMLQKLPEALRLRSSSLPKSPRTTLSNPYPPLSSCPKSSPPARFQFLKYIKPTSGICPSSLSLQHSLPQLSEPLSLAFGT